MKKLFLFLALFTSLVASKANAANWVEFGPKMYFDQSTAVVDDYDITFWMKSLNGAVIGDPAEAVSSSLKPWFQLSRTTVRCGNISSYDMSSRIIFNTSGNVLAKPESISFSTLYPGTNGDYYLTQVFCPLVEKYRKQKEMERGY